MSTYAYAKCSKCGAHVADEETAPGYDARAIIHAAHKHEQVCSGKVTIRTGLTREEVDALSGTKTSVEAQ